MKIRNMVPVLLLSLLVFGFLGCSNATSPDTGGKSNQSVLVITGLDDHAKTAEIIIVYVVPEGLVKSVIAQSELFDASNIVSLSAHHESLVWAKDTYPLFINDDNILKGGPSDLINLEPWRNSGKYDVLIALNGNEETWYIEGLTIEGPAKSTIVPLSAFTKA